MDGAGRVWMRWCVRGRAAAAVMAIVIIVMALTTSSASGEERKINGGSGSHYDSIQLRPRNASEDKPGGGGAPGPGGGGGGGAMEASRVIVALGAVIALIFAVRWAGRRFMGMTPVKAGGGGGAVRVVSKTVLSPKQQLMLVQVGKRFVLVANTGVQMNALCEISDPEEVAGLLGEMQPAPERIVGAGSFLSAFGRAGNTYSGDTRAARDVKEIAHGNESIVPPTRAELAGLLEKVRLMSGAFRKT